MFSKQVVTDPGCE